jgi:hypothetical protein
MFRLFAPPLLVAALALAACGGGSSAAPPTATAEPPTATPDTLQQPTPSDPLPTPAPARDEALALAVTFGDRQFLPTVADFRGLPVTSVGNSGEKGVTIAALAEKVGAPSGALVTIQGYRSDLKTIAFVRKPLGEIASTTIAVLDDEGHVNLVSTSLPAQEWLRAVIFIAFV